MIIRLMYVLPMILGRTYDIKTNSIGLDIFSQKDVSNPRVNEENFYQSSYKTVESSSDVKEILQIDGNLALGIKAGLFSFRGVGSYIKDSMNTQDSVDILTKVSFRTVSKSLPHSSKPDATWFSIGKQYLGTHFVQSILYGGDLIASIRYKAVKSEYLQDIRATIKASLEAGSALDLVGEGKLESLDKKLEKKSNMEINYYATVPLEGVPNTIAGLRDLVRNFQKHVAKVNNGFGVPVEVELNELSSLNSNINFLKNTELETELNFFEEYFDDLLTTKSSLKSWIETLPDTLTKEQETMISEFSDRLSTILRKFIETISDLDLEKGSSQLNLAKEAYKEGRHFGMAGRFRRELNRLMNKIIVSNNLQTNRGSSVYVHFGTSQCVEEEQTSTVYSGYLASSSRNITTAGYNYVCLPKDPEGMTDGGESLKEDTSFIAGLKYGLLENNPFSIDEDVVLRGIVCSVCSVKQRASLVTFLGRKGCPEDEGWTQQYNGYVMSSVEAHGSENICVDTKLEYDKETEVGYFDQSIHFVLAEMKKNVFIPCTVCSK